MATISKPLVEAKYAEAAATTQYTSPAGTRTIIDKFTGYASAAGQLTVSLVAPAGTAGASNIQVVKTFAAGETYTFPELVGHALDPGGFISTLASVASTIVIRSSGRQTN